VKWATSFRLEENSSKKKFVSIFILTWTWTRASHKISNSQTRVIRYAYQQNNSLFLHFSFSNFDFVFKNREKKVWRLYLFKKVRTEAMTHISIFFEASLIKSWRFHVHVFIQFKNKKSTFFFLNVWFHFKNQKIVQCKVN
jgi:hypothetical protein